MLPTSSVHLGLGKITKSPFHGLCKVISIRDAVCLLVYFTNPHPTKTLNQEKQKEVMKQ